MISKSYYLSKKSFKLQLGFFSFCFFLKQIFLYFKAHENKITWTFWIPHLEWSKRRNHTCFDGGGRTTVTLGTWKKKPNSKKKQCFDKINTTSSPFAWPLPLQALQTMLVGSSSSSKSPWSAKKWHGRRHCWHFSEGSLMRPRHEGWQQRL